MKRKNSSAYVHFSQREFVFELDHLLRRRRLRHQVPISYVTPEPFLGHLGMGGAGTIRQLLEGRWRSATSPTAPRQR